MRIQRASRLRRANSEFTLDRSETVMKICFIIHDVTVRSGTERAQANLANALTAIGNSISIWSMYGLGKSPGFPLAIGTDVSYGLRRALPLFLDYPWLMCSFALFAIRRHPHWIVCTDTNRLVVALLAAFVPGVRFAVWQHFALSHSVTKVRGWLARWLAAHLATRIVTLTERDEVLYAKLFAPFGTVTTIPNIVAPPAVGRAVRRREILALGRLVPQKGFDLLLEAWADASKRLPGWSLRVVGDGQMRDQLARLANTLRVEQSVIFAPFSENPFALYSECGVFVLSSRFEGMPFVLIEAMSCGSPCISFDCPNGPRELIEHGVNGILVPAERVDALSDAIVELGENPELRQRLGDAARKVAEQFSEDRIVARWHEVLYGQMHIALGSPITRLGKRLMQAPRRQSQAAVPDPISSITALSASLNPDSMRPLPAGLDAPGQAGQDVSGSGGKRIKLSVLMSVYDRESPDHLRQCLDSLVIQTVPADEVVIVEDGPLGEQLKTTIGEYKRILPIVSLPLPTHVGLGAALRAGVEACRGECVARMDSDDICTPERFQRQMSFLESNRRSMWLEAQSRNSNRTAQFRVRFRRLPAAGCSLATFCQVALPHQPYDRYFQESFGDGRGQL